MKLRLRKREELSLTDKILELTGWGILLLQWLLTTIYYPRLPDSIPVHFDVYGNPDRIGDKTMIWNLPLIASILFTGLAIINYFPGIVHFPGKIFGKYTKHPIYYSTRTIRYLKLIIVIVFSYLLYKTILYGI
jgi:uncharacterized membrane protein